MPPRGQQPKVIFSVVPEEGTKHTVGVDPSGTTTRRTRAMAEASNDLDKSGSTEKDLEVEDNGGGGGGGGSDTVGGTSGSCRRLPLRGS